jgi:acyl-CoA synthetase (AMP-forming)/AMP-acid ligase II
MNVLQRYRLSRDRSVTVANLVDEMLRRNGDREISVSVSGSRSLSDVHAGVCAIDRFLRETVGLRPGQLVAVYRTNNLRCFHWFLAIVRAGGIAVPLNPMLTGPEVRRILATSGAQIVVTDTAVFQHNLQNRDSPQVHTWIQDDVETETLDGFVRAPSPGAKAEAAFPPVPLDPAATAAIFHTSGTSGFPKGAALSSRALLGARASIVLAGLLFGAKDLAVVALPWSHIMAVGIALNGLMAGTRGCFLDRFDVAGVLDVVERLRATAVVGVPAMFTRLVNSNPDPERLKTVRVWLSASDHLPMEVRRQLRQFGGLVRIGGQRLIPPVLVNGYGMVELGGLAMMGVELSFLPGSGDLCFPVPPFKIRVADEDGHPVRAGKTGECQIRRRGLSPHYWEGSTGDEKNVNEENQASEKNGLLTKDGWLRTGDLATRNRLGFIRLVGRIKDVIKSGGYSVYVRELEEAILAHPAVARTAAFGMDHKEKGEIPVAAVELRLGSEASESDLLEWCRKNLAAYKAPRRIWILEPGELPQNHSGKVMRRMLRDRFSAETN